MSTKISHIENLCDKQQYIEAWKLMDELLEEQPYDVKVWQTASHLASSEQNYTKAIIMISEAIRLSPDEPAFYFKRTRDNLNANNYRHALSDAEMVLELSKKWDSIYYVDIALFFKAEVLFRLGNYKQAAEIALGLPEDICHWIGDGVRTRDDLLADCKARTT